MPMGPAPNTTAGVTGLRLAAQHRAVGDRHGLDQRAEHGPEADSGSR